jgi:hypothetical protein
MVRRLILIVSISCSALATQKYTSDKSCDRMQRTVSSGVENDIGQLEVTTANRQITDLNKTLQECSKQIDESGRELNNTRLELRRSKLMMGRRTLELKESRRALKKTKMQLERVMGYNMMCMLNLSTKSHDFPQVSYTDFIQKFDLSAFHNMLPADTRHPPSLKSRRTQSDRKGRNQKFQAAHLIPVAPSCNCNWMPIFVPMFDHPSCRIYPPTLAAEYFVYGVEVPGSNGSSKRAPEQGILPNPSNFICWAHQQVDLDDNPSIMFIPLRDSACDYFSKTGKSKFLVFCSDPTIFVDSLTFKITHSTNDVDCADPQVRKAVDVFNEVMLQVLGHIREHEFILDPKARQSTRKAEAAKEFRCFLRNETGFPRIQLPDHGRIAVLELDDESEQGNPHPLLLSIKSINAWCNFLHQTGQMPRWTAHLAAGLLHLHNTPLVPFTSCRDHPDGVMTCRLCKAREILSNPERFTDLDSYDEGIARIFLDGSETLEDDEMDRLDRLTLREPEADTESIEREDGIEGEDLKQDPSVRPVNFTPHP